MFITILNWNNPLTLVYINFIKVAFIVSQPGQQFQRMDFPLEVKCTMDIGQQGQQEYTLTAISFLILSFTGSFGPRSLCHTLCQTSPFLNLWSDPTFYQCNPVQNTWHVKNKDKYTGNMNLKQNCYLPFVFTSNCVQNCNLSYISDIFEWELWCVDSSCDWQLWSPLALYVVVWSHSWQKKQKRNCSYIQLTPHFSSNLKQRCLMSCFN